MSGHTWSSAQRRSSLLAAGLLLAVLSVLSASPASADPCCVAQNCQDLTPAECGNQNGVEAYCVIGDPCGAAVCDSANIGDVSEVKAVKVNSSMDVELSWLAEANSDSYNVYYDTMKAEIPNPGGNPVAGTTPMTSITSIPHPGAVAGPAGEIFFYSTTGDCTQTPGAVGACCNTDGSCDDGLTATECSNQGGSYQGDNTDCGGVTCEQPEACCDPSGVTACQDLPPTECTNMGFNPQGPGTDCANDGCPMGTGACCNPDGSCDEPINAADCAAQGGSYQGDGSDCASANCEQPEACCDPSGMTACQDLTPTACTGMGFDPQGVGTDCANDGCPPPPSGACCNPDQTCDDGLTPSECTGQGGTYQGDGSDCGSVDCTQPVDGACCEQTGCVDTTDDQCDGPFEPGVTCATAPAGFCELAACCDLPVGCQVLAEFACIGFGGRWERTEPACTRPDGSDACMALPEPGVCCLGPPINSCADGDAGNGDDVTCLSTGGMWIPGEDCANDPCGLGVVGACCRTQGCLEQNEQDCLDAGGTYEGDGTACSDPGVCPDLETGACCTVQGCLDLTEGACQTAQGQFLGVGTSCPDPRCGGAGSGACCDIPPTGACQEGQTEADCTSIGGTYAGDSTTCADCGGSGQNCCAPNPMGGFICAPIADPVMCQNQGGTPCMCTAGGPCDPAGC